MMERTIRPDDIRVGDKIRLTRVIEGTVTRGKQNGYVRIGDEIWHVDPRQGMVNTITLLERDIQLPTAPGSVVALSVPGGLKAHWFLSGNIWVSSLGAEKTPAQFKEWLTLRNYTIEEVAL